MSLQSLTFSSVKGNNFQNVLYISHCSLRNEINYFKMYPQIRQGSNPYYENKQKHLKGSPVELSSKRQINVKHEIKHILYEIKLNIN